MFAWIKKKVLAWQERRRIAQEIRPEAFRSLAQELQELAGMAERIWPQEQHFYQKIKHIQQEMEQLDRLAAQPEFKRLSPQKRLELRQSLLDSRNQLIETMQTVPSPTSTLQ